MNRLDAEVYLAQSLRRHRGWHERTQDYAKAQAWLAECAELLAAALAERDKPAA